MWKKLKHWSQTLTGSSEPSTTIFLLEQEWHTSLPHRLQWCRLLNWHRRRFTLRLKFLKRGLIERRAGNHSRITSYHISLFTAHFTYTLCLSHHGKSLPLADHTDVLFVIWDPVLAVRGFFWRGERCGQLPDPLPTRASLTGGCMHGCAAWKKHVQIWLIN